MLHAPQLPMSDFRSTHALPQVVFAQVAAQTALEQKGAVAGQALLQVPQFAVLDFVSTQTPLHTVPAQVAGAPAEPFAPPTPGELPVPAEPGVPLESLDEQLIVSTAGSASVSEAPTKCALNEPEFSRNRFHIGAPNLKFEKVVEQRSPTAPLDSLHSAATVARES